MQMSSSADVNSREIAIALIDTKKAKNIQQLLFATPTDAYPEDVSSDGKWLLYQEALPNNGESATLKAMPLNGGMKPLLVAERIDFGSNAVLMPGANSWVAYQSSESGQTEVYLTGFPNAGASYEVSPAGGTQPVWSRDGKQLYYLDLTQKLTVVDIRETATPLTLDMNWDSALK